MLSAVSDWLRHLAILLLLAVFLDALLPKTGVQKYARWAFGLVVVLSMLSPVRALVASHLDPETFLRKLSGPLTGTETFARVGVSTADAQYRTDLASALRSDVAGTLSIQLAAVQVFTASGGTSGVPVVTGVQAVSGASVTKAQALEVKYALASVLGLASQNVRVDYPGGAV